MIQNLIFRFRISGVSILLELSWDVGRAVYLELKPLRLPYKKGHLNYGGQNGQGICFENVFYNFPGVPDYMREILGQSIIKWPILL